MASKRTNPDYLNGVPELLLLELLSRRPMHGYELVQSIAWASGGALEFSEGCIYPLLHRLEMEGALQSERTRVGNRSRVVYRVSRAGRKRLERACSRWLAVVRAVERVLNGGAHGRVELA